MNFSNEYSLSTKIDLKQISKIILNEKSDSDAVGYISKLVFYSLKFKNLELLKFFDVNLETFITNNILNDTLGSINDQKNLM